MTEVEAIEVIAGKVTARNPTFEDVDVAFYTERAVNDVLTYCNRSDFPDRLLHVVVDMIQSFMNEQNRRMNMLDDGAPGPLKSIAQNETKFEFAVSEDMGTEALFATHMARLYPLLNKYRRVFYK